MLSTAAAAPSSLQRVAAANHATHRAQRASRLVDKGLTAADVVLRIGCAIPFFNSVCVVARDCLQVVHRAKRRADDLLNAAQRVVDVLEMLRLIAENTEAHLDAGARADVEARIAGLFEDLTQLLVVMDGLSQKNFVQTVIKLVGERSQKLASLDGNIVASLDALKTIYTLHVQSKLLEAHKFEALKFEALTFELVDSVEQAVQHHAESLGASQRDAAKAVAGNAQRLEELFAVGARVVDDVADVKAVASETLAEVRALEEQMREIQRLLRVQAERLFQATPAERQHFADALDTVTMLERGVDSLRLQASEAAVGGVQAQFMRACLDGDLGTVRSLAGGDGSVVVDINAALRHEDVAKAMPAIHYACLGGSRAAVQALVDELGADPRRRDLRGTTPLMRALAHDHVDVAAYLLTKPGVSVDDADNRGRTALMRAAREGRLRTVEWLCAHRADVKRTDDTGVTALEHATNRGQTAVVRYLSLNTDDTKTIPWQQGGRTPALSPAVA